jgi:hypothetical protein
MNQKGIIKTILQEKIITDKFKKREFVITTQDEYPQEILFEVINDGCDKLNDFKIGDLVDVNFNLRGREWINPQGEAKYFNTLQAWKIDRFVSSGVELHGEAAKEWNQMNEQADLEEEDDLPF